MAAPLGIPWLRCPKRRLKITGDIISPIDVEWEAQSDPDRVLNPLNYTE